MDNKTNVVIKLTYLTFLALIQDGNQGLCFLLMKWSWRSKEPGF